MIQFLLMINRQGKKRLSKWYDGAGALSAEARQDLERKAFRSVVTRDATLANFVDCGSYRLVYHRYVGLYVILAVEEGSNVLLHHETIHLFVEILDKFFGCVRELDVVFQFHKVLAILDEFILGGEVQETSKAEIVRRVQARLA
ncbi:AP complex, mu/sigma subunit [Pelagophyceae sp. CCMP2097]|nr:AP complex, mu/sigma subunit [Pelagophyceae sp. CCMP2097]